VKTDDLIDALARDLQPVSVGALGRVLAFSLASGLVLSAALILIAHGLRPDLSPALRLPIFWIKSLYPLALASTGIAAMISVSRPGGVPIACGMTALFIYVVLVALGLWLPGIDFRQLILVLPADHRGFSPASFCGQYLVPAPRRSNPSRAGWLRRWHDSRSSRRLDLFLGLYRKRPAVSCALVYAWHRLVRPHRGAYRAPAATLVVKKSDDPEADLKSAAVRHHCNETTQIQADKRLHSSMKGLPHRCRSS
jgi:hypothetical protein